MENGNLRQISTQGEKLKKLLISSTGAMNKSLHERKAKKLNTKLFSIYQNHYVKMENLIITIKGYKNYLTFSKAHSILTLSRHFESWHFDNGKQCMGNAMEALMKIG